ncbi:MAG TPA: hypothetical protein VH062_10900 [Polyangiaceae bacterium]|jgi:hypothetical protein|nr:hypothetical protein [Polyangiaceae bacterium]
MKSGWTLDPTDIIALVLMGLFAMRRINIRGTDPRAFPQVPIGAFREWQARADRAKRISIHTCFAKFALNSIWFFIIGRHVIRPVLATGGWLIFLGWFGGLMYAWYLSSAAQGLAEVLGIVPGTRLPGPPIDGEGGARAEGEDASTNGGP